MKTQKSLKRPLSGLIAFIMLITTAFSNVSVFAESSYSANAPESIVVDEASTAQSVEVENSEEALELMEGSNAISADTTYSFADLTGYAEWGVISEADLIGANGAIVTSAAKWHGAKYGANVDAGTVVTVKVAKSASIAFTSSVYSEDGYVTAATDDADGWFEATDLNAKVETDLTPFTFVYYGEKEATLTFTFAKGAYIKDISVKMYEGEIPEKVATWEKRDFSLSINGTNVDVVGAEKEVLNPTITLSDGIVMDSSSTSAKLRINLGGKAVDDTMLTVPDGSAYTAAVADGKVVVTFTDVKVAPYSFTFELIDSSVVNEPEAGKTYNYNFAAGEVVPQSAGKVGTYYSPDGLVVVNGGGQLYLHDGSHGLAMYKDNSFDVKVAGDALITFTTCLYGSGIALIPSIVTEGANGKFSLDSIDITNTSGFPETGTITGDGTVVQVSYEGDAATLRFTVDAAGEAYLHGMSVQNLAKALDDNGKIDVWDFGAKEFDDTEYNNWLTKDVINGWYPESVTVGTSGNNFPVTTFTAGDLTYTSTKTNHRLRTTNKALTRYDEGSSTGSIKGFDCAALGIEGCLYFNATSGGGSFTMNAKADDVIYVYIKMDNNADTLSLTKAGATSAYASVDVPLDGGIVKFVVPEDGTYTISDGLTGKPRYYRIIREHSKYVNVSGSITSSDSMPEGYGLIITNTETGKNFNVEVKDGKYSVELPVGYSYSVRLSNAIGFAVTSGLKFDVTSTNAVVNDVTTKAVTYHTLSGAVIGFAADYDLTNMKLYFKPSSENDYNIYGNADITITDSAYSAKLAEGIAYNLVAEGVNDYKVVSGDSANLNADLAQNITFEAKAIYNVTGGFTVNDGSSIAVTALTFTNLEDNYAYKAEVTESGYSIKLRDGEYSSSVEAAEGYKTITHIVVNGADVKKDIYFTSSAVKTYPYVKDIYVGVPGQENNYDTLKEAINVVNNMDKKPASEEERITIHIAPGVYRAQYILKTPYVSLVNTDPTKEVKVTWYYGIGYKYYSCDATGFYNEANAVDKYSKNRGDVAKWGGAFYVQGTASNFYAENIVFENSFNKYVTEEEIADGVEPNLVQSIRFDRTAKDADVLSKDATERASAMLVEGDNAEFYRCSFLSSQDTLYIGNSINSYYNECFVSGMTDYIFGDGEVVFDKCELNFCGYSSGALGGYITATRFEKGGMGYLFNGCTITKNANVTTPAGYFGRPWGAGATVKFINSVLQDADTILAKGYHDMTGKPEDANYAEYGTKLADGTEVDTSSRRGGVMTFKEASELKMTDWFGTDWTPKSYVYKPMVEEPVVVKGDVNSDNKVTALDASIVFEASLGKFTLDDIQTKAADVDGTEGISANDASMILQNVLNPDKNVLE